MRSSVTIIEFHKVDEDADDGSRIIGRFDCQVGPVRLYQCELRATPKGRQVRLPSCATVAWGVLMEMRSLARLRVPVHPKSHRDPCAE